jgi:hypothetical protein
VRPRKNYLGRIIRTRDHRGCSGPRDHLLSAAVSWLPARPGDKRHPGKSPARPPVLTQQNTAADGAHLTSLPAETASVLAAVVSRGRILWALTDVTDLFRCADGSRQVSSRACREGDGGEADAACGFGGEFRGVIGSRW